MGAEESSVYLLFAKYSVNFKKIQMDLSLRSETTQSVIVRGGRKTGDVITDISGQLLRICGFSVLNLPCSFFVFLLEIGTACPRLSTSGLASVLAFF